jgi:branched-chain amino acid transport system permease protein
MASIAGTDITSRAEAPPVTGTARTSRGTAIALAVVALVLAAVPYALDERFGYHIAIMVCFAAIGAGSLHLIIRTGHVSLCHSAFVGVGAYASANVVMKLHLPFVAGLLAGTLAAAALALVIGPIILRLTGKYFVLITFLLGEILRMVFVDWIAVTGGANGLSDIPSPSPAFADPKSFYLLALAAAVFCIAVCGRILSSEIGRFVNAIRESEQLAECVGVPVIRTKILMFVIACAFAGFAGSLLAHYAHYISPPNFGPIESLNLVIMNVIGGMNTLIGPLIGAFFLVLVPELLRGYVQLQHVIFGLVLIVVMAFMPGGMAGLRETIGLIMRGSGKRAS